MSNELDKVFRDNTKVIINRQLLKNVLEYVNNFIRKDEDSINFWGGGLIGVYKVLYTEEDDMIWLNDILEVYDSEKLQNDIKVAMRGMYREQGKEYDTDFVVSTSAANNSFIWLAHQALVNTTLSIKEKEQLSIAAINMMQFKAITSLLYRRFPHKANMEIALALYESLNNKNQLKQCGTWFKTVEERSITILDNGSQYRDIIYKYNDDYQTVRLLNNVWNGVKSLVNSLTDKFYQIHASAARITASDKFMMVDGEKVLKDSTNKYIHIKEYMHHCVPDKYSFIKPDLVEVTLNVINTAYPQYVNTSLNFISNNYNTPKYKDELMSLVDDTLMFVFDFCRKEKIELVNIALIANRLGNLLRSSRVNLPEFLSIKERMGNVIDTACVDISNTNMSSTRVVVILYIVLRALIQK